VNTDTSGFFKFCGLPTGIEGTVRATRSDLPTADVPVSTSASLLSFEALTMAPSRSARGKGVVRGIVVSQYDKPLIGARVEAPVTGVFNLSKADGTFSIDSVPTGTQLIYVRQLGFEPVSVQVNVSSRFPAELRVTLGPIANILDPVLVTARRDYRLDTQGFFKRQRSGWGTFITRDEIERRRPQFITDLLTNIPGLYVVRTSSGTMLQSDRVLHVGGAGGDCARLWVDGTEWRAVMPGDLDAFVSAHDVAAIEVYRPGTTPAQFAGIGDCVTLVVWTQMQLRVALP
jgi:hypothetical protein